MAKKGQKIDELYISLGLDISELDADFALADKTVNEAMADLNRRKTQIKLKADIDTNKLTGAAASTDALAIKEKALTQELELQRQRVSLVTAAYKDAVKVKGENSGLAQKMQINLLREQQTYTKLEAEIRKTNLQIGKTGTQLKAVPHTSGIKSIMNEVTGLTSGFGTLNAKAMAFVGVMSTGAGFLNLTNSAMQSGEGLYQLSKKLNMTTAEASKMKRIFDMGGVEVQAIVERLATLDKGVLSAGAAGNETTKAMDKFGVSLQDASGNLRPMNEQLEQLALGYKNAAESGRVEAYVAEVLGSEGAKLIPILEQYEELSLATSRIRTTGLLNPQEAHDLYIEWKILNAEAGQLKSALGAALMPVAKEVMPSLIAGTESMIAAIRENKDEILDLTSSFASLVSMAGTALSTVGDVLGAVGLNTKDTSAYLKETAWLMDKHPTAMKKNILPLGVGGAVNHYLYKDEYAAYREQQEAMKAANKAVREQEEKREQEERDFRRKRSAEETEIRGKERNAAARQQLALDEAYHKTHTRLENEIYDIDQKTKKAIENGMEQTKADELAEQQRLELFKRVNAEKEAANRELKESIFTMTHNELENSLHALEEKAKEYRNRGADETIITQETEAAKAKIMQDFQENTVSKIDAVWKTSLQNRLDDIEREKEAWKKKGIDEVKAAQWAEHEKSAARKKEAMAILTSQKKEFDVYKKAMQGQTGGFDGGAKSFRPDSSKEERMQVAQQEIMRKKFKDLGITSEDLAYLTPEHMEGFNKIQKNIDDSFFEMPKGLGIADYIPDPNSPIRYRDTSGVRQEDLDKLNYATPQTNQIQNMSTQNVNVTVNIDSPVVQDDAMITQIADTAADKIKGAINQALGGDDNRY